ncbi:ensconsin isoform X3 [Hyla sarda]|uniref:ensconsin isoform X3 n=1 Tax=Hyla sarda TaxID=327740 RepID=UPI0024C46419|nr:ensconsin isoform X3 [Hyla sarda]
MMSQLPSLLYSPRLLQYPLSACRWRVTSGIHLRGTHLSTSHRWRLRSPRGEVPLLLDDVSLDMAERQQLQEEPKASPEFHSDTAKMQTQAAVPPSEKDHHVTSIPTLQGECSIMDSAREGCGPLLTAAAPDGPHGKVQEKKMSLSQARKDNALSKSEPHLTLKVDERQRLARERREEREKLMAARESLWLEKEMRAQQHYAKQLEERKKKLEEQRLKEERRRAAVDEKRRQKLEEEKERHEAVVKRTMERSQKPKQKNNRWSWGGILHSNTSISSSDPDRRSVSTMNLSKHVDPVITKRLSTSSATLLNTPDRGRRPQLSSWESNVVSRLLTPTHSYLARSKSTAALSGDAASCSPISPQLSKTPISKSSEKAKQFFTTPEATARRRTTHFGGTSSVEKKEKRETDRENLLTPISIMKRAISPSVSKLKSQAPMSAGSSHKSSPRSVPAIVNSSIKLATTPQRPLSPGNVRPVKKDSKEDSKMKPEEIPAIPSKKESTEEKNPPEANGEKPRTPSPVSAETMQEPPTLPPTSVLASPTVTNKPFAGTTDPGEATRILAEKRKLAREQREREEEEKREREEKERRKKEEIAQRQAMERARREEEAKQLEAERKEKEEMERQEKERLQKQLAEEKEQREREEAERLQKQKEEADRIRVEREKHFQKEEQERSERKKRLEEIMKRTRRSETGEKPSVQKNGEIPKPMEDTAITPTSLQEEQTSVFLQSNAETPQNGEPVVPSPRIVTFSQALPVDSTEKQPNENGLCTPNNNFEEIINLPVGSKPMKLDSLKNDGNSIQDLPPLNPLIAFEVDNVQTQQTTEVI